MKYSHYRYDARERVRNFDSYPSVFENNRLASRMASANASDKNGSLLVSCISLLCHATCRFNNL